MNTADVDIVEEYSDIIDIRARNVQNFPLLKKVGQGCKPIALKQGMMTTVKELLMSAVYILASGNDKVIPLARAARTVGADGLLVEVHPEPEKALSDGIQSLKPEKFYQPMEELRGFDRYE
jgi:3-deoxy-7-phosphoheptulonate synthase